MEEGCWRDMQGLLLQGPQTGFWRAIWTLTMPDVVRLLALGWALMQAVMVFLP